MAEAGRSWYTELDFDSYVLDLLLLGWCTLCVVVVVAANALVAAFGPLQRQPQDRYKEYKEIESLSGAVLPIETAQWFNSAVNWFYLHYYHAPEFVDEWLKALNEQLGKLGGPVQARFDRIQSGSLPPKITHVSCEASPQDRFIIHAKLESRDLSFVVFASQQTHEGVKLTNVMASVLRMKGTLRLESYREGGDVKMNCNLEGNPEIKVQVKPLNPYQDASELVDLGVVEVNVRNSIKLAKTTFTITHLLMPGDLHTMAAAQLDKDKGPPGGGQGQGKGPIQQSVPGACGNQNFPNQSGSGPSGGLPHRNVPQQQQQSHERQEVFEAGQAMFEEAISISTITRPSAETVSMPISELLSAPARHISVQNEHVQGIPVHTTSQRETGAPLSKQNDLLLQQQVGQQQLKEVIRRDQQRVRPQSRSERMFEPIEAISFQNSTIESSPIDDSDTGPYFSYWKDSAINQPQPIALKV